MDDKKRSISKFKKRNNFRNVSLSYVDSVRDYDSVPPHWHNFYELELVVGTGEGDIDGIVHKFEHGAFAFLSPTSFHSWKFSNENFRCYNFNFQLDILNSENIISLASQAKNSFFSVPSEELAWYEHMFENFNESWNKVRLYDKEYCLSILEFLLIHILKNGETTNQLYALSPTKNSNRLSSAIIYIHKNYRQNITAEDVAKHIYLSPKYLSSLFRKELGVTFSQYLTNLRLTNACNMLCSSSDSVKEIAIDSGFNNTKHFQNVFKKHYNMTPLEYRKNNLF